MKKEKSLSEFTNLYSLQKTLKFELKPIGKTLQHIEEKGLLKEDENRAKDYQVVKKIIDRYHKVFIEEAFELALHEKVKKGEEKKSFSYRFNQEVEKFSKQLLALITDSTSCLIALHNNTEQAFSIKSYLPGHDRQFDAKAVYADSLQDVDDIILTTDSLLYQKMADNHYNSIWQDNDYAKKDGSLSIFFGEQKRRYINIETQHGKMKQYREMLENLLKILLEENKLLPGNIEVTL